jgi:hypothetical protein
LCLLTRTIAIDVALIDPLDTKTALRCERRRIRLNCVENSFTVVSLSKCGHEPLALNLSDQSVRQIAFDMTAHLREVLAILDRDYQQETRFVSVLWTNAPAARYSE